MLEKFAEMSRLAEVRGCVAAMVDAGLVKVANERAFDGLCNVVTENIGYDYDLEKVAETTGNVIKLAGAKDIAAKVWGGVKGAGQSALDALRFKGLGTALADAKAARSAFGAGNCTTTGAKLIRNSHLKNIAKKLGKGALAWGGIGATGLGGKYLYDKGGDMGAVGDDIRALAGKVGLGS